MQKNIIFVIVDALRADRLESGGYYHNLALNINKIAESGLNFTDCHSTGCPTSVAFPSIWTSTMPLDYGGYANGVYGRPNMLSEELQSHGYQTFGITTGHPSSSQNGYDRGFDTFVDLIDMYQWFRSKYITNFKDDIDSWTSNSISDDDICKKISTSYGSMLVDTIKIISNINKYNVCNKRNNINKLHKALINEQNTLEINTMQIVCKLKQLKSNFSVAIGNPTVTKWIKVKIAYKKVLRFYLNRKIAFISNRKLNSGKVVNNVAKNILRGVNKERPFFLYIHYFDLHEYKFLIPQMSFKRLAHLPGDIFKAYKARGLKGGGFLYDLALINVDRHILELRNNINKNVDISNTLIVLTSDHGTYAGPPFRPKASSFEHLFFDNFTHVPLMINGIGIAAKTSHKLISHLDLAPSILDVSDIPISDNMQGTPVFDCEKGERDYVISESGGSGQCNISKKPFYISIRSKKIRCTYIINNFIPIEREVYDLYSDPDESINLIDTNYFMEWRNRFKSITKRRVKRLHKTSL